MPLNTSLAELPSLDEVREEKARRKLGNSLLDYVGAAWHVIEPATTFVPNWHIDAICEHLEAVTRGEIRNLLINMPPRNMKSLLVSVFWPTWVWTADPSVRWLYSAYGQDLSKRDSLKCRRLIDSPWYQQLWGEVFTLTTDQNTKQRFENDKTGYRIATSVGGLGTGEGGDVIVVDDPHNVEEALSGVQRATALTWWDETMSTRLNDPNTGAKVIVMQRLHEGDLAGHVLERGGYEHLMLPMEYERDRHCTTSLGWEDPRVREEELLWPARFTPEAVATLKQDLGPYGTAGQLQQRPAPRGGGYFKEDWLRWYETPPKHVYVYGASDYAVTADGGDYTVHGVIGVDPDDNIFVLDWWREQTESDVWIEVLLDLMKKHKPLAWAEEAGQIEKSIGPFLRKRMRERKVYCLRRPYTSSRDKATRARSIEARMSMGMVYLPKNAPWKDDLVSELLHFPAGVHDDQVDVLSLVGRMLDRLVPGRVPKEPKPINLGQPTLDELLALQPKHDSEGYDRI